MASELKQVAGIVMRQRNNQCLSHASFAQRTEEKPSYFCTETVKNRKWKVTTEAAFHFSVPLCFASDLIWWGKVKRPLLFCCCYMLTLPLHSRPWFLSQEQRENQQCVNSLVIYNTCGGSNFASKTEWNSSLHNF